MSGKWNNTAASVRDVSRKLKSNEPDLKIIVAPPSATNDTNANNNNNNNGDDAKSEQPKENGEEVIVRWYQSASMAEHSTFIDETIQSMKVEGSSKPYEIRFDDISAETWDLMMQFLDPVESRDMQAKHVLLVAEFFDRYDFVQGRKLCDRILQEYFAGERANEPNMDVDLIVDAVAMCYRSHLNGAFALGSQFLKEKLTQYKRSSSGASSSSSKYHPSATVNNSNGVGGGEVGGANRMRRSN